MRRRQSSVAEVCTRLCSKDRGLGGRATHCLGLDAAVVLGGGGRLAFWAGAGVGRVPLVARVAKTVDNVAVDHGQVIVVV